MGHGRRAPDPRKGQIMFALRGDEGVPYTADALFQDIVNELRPDGIETRVVLAEGEGDSPMIEAWYTGHSDQVATVHCKSTGLSPEIVDCLVTTIREQLGAGVSDKPVRYTWDHTGTLWPD